MEKKITKMIDVIEDAGYVKGMIDRLRELEARQDELKARLAIAPANLPDIHPNVTSVYRQKVERLAEALNKTGGARRSRRRHPWPDRTYRANARGEPGRDGRRAAWRPGHHP